jgi:hypothetical protein
LGKNAAGGITFLVQVGEMTHFCASLRGISHLKRPKHRLGRSGILLPALAALMILACARDKQIIDLDYRFSLNVAKTPLGFPGPKMKLAPAEAEVIRRRGSPDFIRIWWRPDGSLIRSSDLSAEGDRLGETLNNAKKSWLYMDSGEEVIFTNQGASYSVRPIDEIIKLICNYGDPTSRSPAVIRDGQKHETWIWVEHGIQIEMVDDKEVSRQYFPASGRGTYLGK